MDTGTPVALHLSYAHIPCYPFPVQPLMRKTEWREDFLIFNPTFLLHLLVQCASKFKMILSINIPCFKYSSSIANERKWYSELFVIIHVETTTMDHWLRRDKRFLKWCWSMRLIKGNIVWCSWFLVSVADTDSYLSLRFTSRDGHEPLLGEWKWTYFQILLWVDPSSSSMEFLKKKVNVWFFLQFRFILTTILM